MADKSCIHCNSMPVMIQEKELHVASLPKNVSLSDLWEEMCKNDRSYFCTSQSIVNCFMQNMTLSIACEWLPWLKGLVHPKMKILSLITHRHVKPVRLSFIFGTQIKIFLMKSKSSLTLHRQQRNCNVPSPRNVARTSIKQSMWHQWLNFNFAKLWEYFFVCKENKNNIVYSKALRFHQKYLNLCSEDERRSYGFGWNGMGVSN